MTSTPFTRPSMPMPRRPLSLLLLFLPTALLALSLILLLLLLAGDGLGLLCLSGDQPPVPLQDPLSKTPSLLALSEEIPFPKPNSHQSFDLLPDSSNGYPQPDAPVHSRKPKWSKRSSSGKKSKLLLRLLQPSSRSRRFSTKVARLFGGYSSDSSSCQSRFFMTWISSVEAFGPRELFVVESLFKSHQNACLLVVSNTMDSVRGARLLRPFSERGFRVAAVAPDFAYLFRSTPAERWFERLRRGEVDPGEVSLGQNLSNLLRLAVLYKYGGVYIDTDVIVLRSFSGLRNAIGAQTIDAETGNWSRLNNAVMVFDKKHPLLYQFIGEFTLTFDGSKWGHNGPYLVSRVVEQVAGKPGFEFSVLPPPAFYPVDWRRIQGLFHGPRGRSQSKWVLAKLNWIRGESFAVHLWNRQSRRLKVEEGSIIRRIMLDRCVICNFSTSAM